MIDGDASDFIISENIILFLFLNKQNIQQSGIEEFQIFGL